MYFLFIFYCRFISARICKMLQWKYQSRSLRGTVLVTHVDNEGIIYGIAKEDYKIHVEMKMHLEYAYRDNDLRLYSSNWLVGSAVVVYHNGWKRGTIINVEQYATVFLIDYGYTMFAYTDDFKKKNQRFQLNQILKYSWTIKSNLHF